MNFITVKAVKSIYHGVQTIDNLMLPDVDWVENDDVTVEGLHKGFKNYWTIIEGLTEDDKKTIESQFYINIREINHDVTLVSIKNISKIDSIKKVPWTSVVENSILKGLVIVEISPKSSKVINLIKPYVIEESTLALSHVIHLNSDQYDSNIMSMNIETIDIENLDHAPSDYVLITRFLTGDKAAKIWEQGLNMILEEYGGNKIEYDKPFRMSADYDMNNFDLMSNKSISEMISKTQPFLKQFD